MLITVIYALGLALAFFMAWCLGANDASNPTECAVGAGVVSMRRAILLFALFAAIGGVSLGPFVMKTVDRGIVDRQGLTTQQLVVGSLVAVASAIVWVVFSTWKGMPVSTTHSTIGGVLGCGLAAGGWGLVVWDKFTLVLVSILISPLLTMALSFGFFHLFRRHGGGKGILLVVVCAFLLSFTTAVTVFYKVLKWEDSALLFGSGTLLAVAMSALAGSYFKRKRIGSLEFLLLLALIFSAFAFGANDMANCTGVFVTPTEVLVGKPELSTMLMLAVFGSIGIALGGFTWGYRVITTAAYKVTRLDPLTGFAAEFANALNVFLFTVVPGVLTDFGIPISTTHSSIGSIIGVGIAKGGIGAVDWGVTWKIIAFWILTIPATALLSGLLFKLATLLI